MEDRPVAKEIPRISIQTIPKRERQETKQIQKKEITLDVEPEEKIDLKKSEDKIKVEPFPAEKPKEKIEETGETRTSEQFEKALSSAIEKTHTEKKQQEPTGAEVETKQKAEDLQLQPTVKIQKVIEEEQAEAKKKITVRCPQCKFEFPAKKEGEFTRIKCPQCGKEGVIK